MKILAFMQNPWFPPGTTKEIVDRYRTDQQFHQKLLRRTMSGNRLLQAFGPKMFEEIHWDNVAPNHVPEPHLKSDIEMMHVERIIKQVNPDLILTFGNLAREAVEGSLLRANRPMMHCHHPNARHKTMNDLAQFAMSVQRWVEDADSKRAREEYLK